MLQKSLVGLMYDYKDTKNELVLEKIINILKPYIINLVNSKLLRQGKKVKNMPIDKEDFVSIGISAIWASLDKYLFYCPVCGIIAKTRKSYVKHCKKMHSKIHVPKISIEWYVKQNIKTYIANKIKKELWTSKRRSNLERVEFDIFAPDYYEDNLSESKNNYYQLEKIISLVPDMSDYVIFNNLVKESINTMDKFSREILIMLAMNMPQIEIAEYYYRIGKYSSLKSSAVMVNRTIKNKLRKYCEWIIK